MDHTAKVVIIVLDSNEADYLDSLAYEFCAVELIGLVRVVDDRATLRNKG